MEKREHEYFVDGNRYESTAPELTGIQIKQTAAVPATYQLFLEEEGDTPDRHVPDSELINLAKRVRHFFAVPPATFGI